MKKAPVSHHLRLAVPALALALSVAACDEDDDPFVKADGGADASVQPQADGSVTPTDTAVPGDGGTTVAGDGGARDGGPAGDGGTAGDVAPVAPNVVYAAVRLDDKGALDPLFGTGGIARVSLGAGANALGNPAIWNAALDAQGGIILFGAKKHATRADNERAVARLTPTGQLDMMFGTMGFTTFGIEGISDGVRGGIVDGDKIVSSGYTSQPTGVGTQSVNKILLARLDLTGKLDSAFGVGGIVNDAPFKPVTAPETTMWGMAEAYNVVKNGAGYVTTGYGWSHPQMKNPLNPTEDVASTVDVVAVRYGADGKRDLAWGMANGATLLDHNKGNDRGRNLVGLKDGRVFVVGTATTSNYVKPVTGTATATIEDAMVVMLTAAGLPDTTFYPTTGHKLFDAMAADEEFYGAAAAPNDTAVAAVGYRSGAAGQDDDSLLLVQPLATGATSVFSAVELSTTTDDRLWTAAFDAQGRLYAAGSITESGDTRMAVARFTIDGTTFKATLDPTFGTAGIAKVNVATAGTAEAARGIVIQGDGKIVIAGPAEAQ